MSDKHDSTSIAALLANQGQFPSIPARHPDDDLTCCCGRSDCANLLHNNAALDDLERNLYTAAQLGQALLVRHETYMVEAERTREEMSMRIETLEHDKEDLETRNRRTIEENRGLLNQLEDLNLTIATSETHVKSLEATLQSAQLELRRLEHLAARTQDLDLQLAALEAEQLLLQQTVANTEDDERSAIQRWKKAERSLFAVQDQLERIEREAQEERERHDEVIGRMERQREVERELNAAAGRLKGAAAATSLQTKSGSNNVVSHFVKDILHDNANLQVGIVELREMLENSNNEVEILRQQVMLHQPFTGEDEDNDSGTATLRAELAPKESQLLSQELHIHHHYHGPQKDKIPRPKKKRHAVNPRLFTPPNGRMRQSPASIAAAILSHTSITIPSPATPDHRWSMASTQTMSDFASSSAPSSPRSNYRTPLLFDRNYIDSAMDSSRPTSPDSSVDPTSPALGPYHRKRDSNYSFKQPPAFNLGNTIHEEGEDGDIEDMPSLQSTAEEPILSNEEASDNLSTEVTSPEETDFFSPSAFQPSLRRATSHESILSISGIDIHTLKSRPSQLTITNPPHLLKSRSRPSISTLSTSYISSQPVTSSSMATARPTLSRRGYDSTTYLRSSMGLSDSASCNGCSRPGSMKSTSSGNSGNSGDSAPSSQKKAGTSGWMWNRWGTTPTPALASITSTPVSAVHAPMRAVSTPAMSIAKVQTETDPLKSLMGRSPGINQKGPVPGRWMEVRRPAAKIVPERVDRVALKEVLEEELG